MSDRDVEHRCVACSAALQSWRAGEAACERCPRCGGLWIETTSFLTLLGATPTAQHPDELMVHNDGSRRRACPHCLEPMDPAWLDAGELERALASAQPNAELEALVARMQPKRNRTR